MQISHHTYGPEDSDFDDKEYVHPRPNETWGTKYNLDFKVNGQGHSADAINNDISQTVGCTELILTCSLKL